MKLSVVIERLQEIQRHFGDLETAVGETSGLLRTRFDIEVQPDYEREEDETKVCIVQAYLIKGGFGK